MTCAYHVHVIWENALCILPFVLHMISEVKLIMDAL